MIVNFYNFSGSTGPGLLQQGIELGQDIGKTADGRNFVSNFT